MAKSENKVGFVDRVKSLFLPGYGNGLHDQTSIVNPADWRGAQGNGMFYFGAAGGGTADLYVSTTNSKQWYWNAYQFCPVVASIINRKAEAFINGNTAIVTKGGKGKGKESQGVEAKKIRDLMKQPNPLQSWAQFEAQYYTYFQIYGYCIILPIRPAGFKDPTDTKYLWIIPPAMVDVKENQKIWYADEGKTLIDSVKLTYGKETATLAWDELIILKDFTPNCSSLIMPDSRLLSLKVPIETVIKGYRAMSSGFDNTPLGIIGNDTKDSMSFIPLTPEEKLKLESELNVYGLGPGQKKFILSNANLTWKPINYPIDTLKLPEHTRMATAAIADGLGYPFSLLSSEKGVTFDNQNTSGKDLYQNYIIPVSKRIYEQWNEYFKADELNLCIENDFSWLPILQQGDLEKSQARLSRNNALIIEFYNNMITLNRWIEINGEEPLAAEEGKLYYYQLVALGWKFGATSAPSAAQKPEEQKQNGQ